MWQKNIAEDVPQYLEDGRSVLLEVFSPHRISDAIVLHVLCVIQPRSDLAFVTVKAAKSQ